MRIGINVPNELMQRLEPLKPQLNISQVCREALAAKAEEYERMKTIIDNDDAIRAAAERFGEREAEFRAAIEVDWPRLGHEDALAWVKAASWEEWWDLREDISIMKEEHRPLWEFVFPAVIDGVPNFFTRMGELHDREREMEKNHHGFSRWYLGHRSDYQADREAYMTAWLAFTDAVWELIRQRELEYLDEQIARRTPLPQPEVPEHIVDSLHQRCGR